jgi:acetyl-CoA C-acetyltransferase
MTVVDPRSPCIIGVGQRTWRPDETDGDAPEPLAMWEEVARVAAADSGATHTLDRLDSIQIVYCQSWQYDDPPARLAERLRANPRHQLYSGIGGTTPQLLVQTAGEAILGGEYDVALVTGAEALETRRQLKKRGEKPGWSHRHPQPPPFPFEAPFHPAEVAHEVFQAWLTFAVFEIARRGALGVAPADYREGLGRLLAPMTEVAARNPYAWFPRIRTADELITATPGNRMVGYPYTKYMVSIMDVDMAAAVIVASHQAADDLGVPADRRVYLRGWCYATDDTYVAEHEPMSGSPAMRAASIEALTRAGVGIDEVAHLDLYSCFGSSVHFALDALGLQPGDPRGVTVTGGLPFNGGAGSNYLSHSIVAMTGVLRADPGSVGLVSGVGMHMTKHVYGLYSTGPGAVRPPDSKAVQARLDAGPHRQIRDVADGPATVAAYSVAHGREGGPEWGLAVCDLPDGPRAYAKILAPELLAQAEEEELVGAAVDLETDGKVNVVRHIKR